MDTYTTQLVSELQAAGYYGHAYMITGLYEQNIKIQNELDQLKLVELPKHLDESDRLKKMINRLQKQLKQTNATTGKSITVIEGKMFLGTATSKKNTNWR